MNKQAAASGSYIEPEEQQPIFSYNYRDYPKDRQPRTGYLHLSQSIEEEPEDDVTVITQSTDSVDEKSVIHVYLRIKPSKSKSNPFNENVLEVRDNHSVVLKQPKDMKANVIDTSNVYKFSDIYGPHIVQSQIFSNIVHGMLERYLNGEDALLFSFGTTNSGKTFTIQGTTENPGIIPRTLNVLFNSLAPYLNSEMMFRPTYALNVTLLSKEDSAACLEIKKKILSSSDQGFTLYTTASSYHTAADDSSRMFRSLDREHTAFSLNDFDGYYVSLWISFYEVYNEKIYDLLDVSTQKPPQKKKILKIGRDRGSNVYIKDLIYINVHSSEEAYRVLRFGMANLSIASTELNNKSSRSHCVFSIKLVKVDKITEELEKMSSFEICDLAGAERQKRAHTSGERLREARTINSSLHVLSRCFQVLRENSGVPEEKKKLVPFRDSKLTQIFQRSLRGSNAVKMIVNVNASPSYAEETMQVLKISSVARELLTVVKPRRPAPIRRHNRFSMMVSRNMDWQEAEQLDFDQMTGYNPFQSTVEQDQSFETIRALESKINELMEENQEMKENIEKLKEFMDEQRKDWQDDRKKMTETHDREKERLMSFHRAQTETLKSAMMQYVEALQEREEAEDLDESTRESQQRVIITHLRQEVKDADSKLQELSGNYDQLKCEVKELNGEKTQLESKNKELETKVNQLTNKIKEMESDKMPICEKSAEITRLTVLLNDAKLVYQDQEKEIANLGFELDELREENKKLEMKCEEMEEIIEEKDAVIIRETDIAEDLQEKLDYMETKFQTVTVEYERLVSDKEKVITELRSNPQLKDNMDELMLQKEIKNLSALLVAKDQDITDLKAKLKKYGLYWNALKEDRKTKEKNLAELKPKCEELTQKITTLETDCAKYMNTINQMENDEQSTKRNHEKLLSIYEDHLKSAQEELALLKGSQLSSELAEVCTTPSGRVAQLQTKVKTLEEELVQRNNVVRDLQLGVIEKGEIINKLQEQIEKSIRSPLQALENKMSRVSLCSPEDCEEDDPDFLPNPKCKSTTKKRRIKPKTVSLNKTATANLAPKLNPIATPRRKLFNSSENSEDMMKTPEDMSPVSTVVPSPKSQIKNKLRGRKKLVNRTK